MSVPKSPVRKKQIAYSWGIILGMSGVPILALAIKLVPAQGDIWLALMAVCGVIVLRSVIGYIFPMATLFGKKADEDAHGSGGKH